jgi:hypothetical protein
VAATVASYVTRTLAQSVPEYIRKISALIQISQGVPPASLAEFTLGASSGLDYYDVSLVDGYKYAPMLY